MDKRQREMMAAQKVIEENEKEREKKIKEKADDKLYQQKLIE